MSPCNMDIIPTYRDVINGRGQGMLRHPGNVKYRKLVTANKELYARCPNGEKIEISKGIVAAIRNFQGRFLDIEKEEGKYFDIGDQKAIAKTSQALREGQGKIRQLLRTKSSEKQSFQVEQYFAFSVKVLGELYNSQASSEVLSNNVAGMETKLPLLPPIKQSRNLRQQMVPPPSNETNFNNTAFTTTSSTAVKMALDQFPMATPSIINSNTSSNITQQQDYRTNAYHNPSACRSSTEHSTGRHTKRDSTYSDMSMASISSISAIHTISSDQNIDSSSSQGNRVTIDSLMTSQSHQKIFDAEKRMYDLEYIDEASSYQTQTACFEKKSGMSFTAIREENSESSEDADDAISLTDKSFDEFSLSSATDDIVKLILGLSSEDVTCTYAVV
ncbi:hypothetical protein HJC23_007255 [Cyclotella cryptica]|uniref:DUF6824 domain-containing protein n=1 Tax=Cyclotella cryptica TaxID=29204 RepID=A0ABD3Q5G8_9STRA